MHNAFPTGVPLNKFKSFTPGLLLSSVMEINNSLLFDINFLRSNQPLLHILMTFFTRVFAVSLMYPLLTLIDHLHGSCFASYQLLLFQTPRHCQQIFFLRHNLHSWPKMLLQRHGHTLQKKLHLYLCCDQSTTTTL